MNGDKWEIIGPGNVVLGVGEEQNCEVRWHVPHDDPIAIIGIRRHGGGVTRSFPDGKPVWIRGGDTLTAMVGA